MHTQFRKSFRSSRLAPALLLGLLGCGIGRSRPPLDRSQDDRIRQQVEARLEAEPSVQGSGVRVVVDGATVLLHGRVQGIAAWQCAITNAELVTGVRSVVDYLVIERGSRDTPCRAPRSESEPEGETEIVKP